MTDKKSKKNPKKTSEDYEIILCDSLYQNVDFSKKYFKFYPINAAFLLSYKFEKLSASAAKILMQLYASSMEAGSKRLVSSEVAIRKPPTSYDKALIELEENQLLTRSSLIKKERKKVVVEAITNDEKDFEENPPETFCQKDDQSKFAKHFESFVTEKIGSADFGFVNSYWKKTHDAFFTTSAFDEFCSIVMDRKNFQSGTWKNQFSYFRIALDKEIKSRLSK